jgi:IclR family acetate operon transcriptional repressor
VAEQIDRLLAVMRVLMNHPDREWGVRELAAKLGMGPSTVQRILASLEQRSLAVQSENARYSPGANLYALASRLLGRSDLMTVAYAVMRELVDDVNETAHLALYNGMVHEAVFSASVQCDRPVRYVIEPGMRVPLNAGATAKAMLAYLPESVVSSIELPKFTERTVVDRDTLLKELAAIRKRGYATSIGERIEGASGIASAVMSRDRVVGALTITIPTYRLERKQIPVIGSKLARAAESISVRLGKLPDLIEALA